jgi:hypothetical protein
MKLKLRGLSPQANYTDRASDRRLSAKLVPSFAVRGRLAVSVQGRPQKARQVKSEVKSMLIIFFDIKGVVHKEFVLEGTVL